MVTSAVPSSGGTAPPLQLRGSAQLALAPPPVQATGAAISGVAQRSSAAAEPHRLKCKQKFTPPWYR
ncbi:MAG: hypothetical protein NVSMB23_14610 [Myxococcales bacterium]